MKAWINERCAERPEELQDIGCGLYMERRNIREVHHEADEVAGTEEYTDYECECREVTADEYHVLQSIKEIDTSSAIDAYTQELLEEGLL